MEWLTQVLVILGLFILRLGVPLAIILIVGYGLRRLDAKWQAEARAQLEASQAEQKAAREPQIKMLKVIEEPCWIIKGCPQTVYTQCPAYQHPDTPCWMARFRAEGAIPAKCYRCALFSQRQAEKPLLS